MLNLKSDKLRPLWLSAIRYLIICLFFAITACQTPKTITKKIPVGSPQQVNNSKPFIISAANPIAARAGQSILRAGGSAVDAAIATQMVLTLVEPQSSGLGGGGFLMHFDPKSGAINSYDGRETAPSSATPDMFLDIKGNPIKFYDAAVGGLSVGVPGLLRMLEDAHKDHGILPWAKLFGPAIKLSREGFFVSKRLAKLIASDKFLKTSPTTKNYFFQPDGTPKVEGDRLINIPLAESLEKISNNGADYFYQGPLSQAIIDTVANAYKNPKKIRSSDFTSYQTKKRPPVCLPYRKWLICGMGPPSSGGITTLQILGLLQRFNLSAIGPMSERSIHLISEASALAFADRNTYIADPDFIPVPSEGMIDPSYLKSRALEIPIFKSGGKRQPGMPGPVSKIPFAPNGNSKGYSTTHMSILDNKGNSVSMTTSIENVFGSRLMIGGFLLNNQLSDFSFRPFDNGAPIANRVSSSKRPRSSMAPTFVFNGSGELVMAIGSPGGSNIIGYVVKTIVGVLDWGLSLNQAINYPNFTSRNGSIDLEKDTTLALLKPKLEAMGHKVRVVPQISGLHGILIRNGKLEGGVDKRREGIYLKN